MIEYRKMGIGSALMKEGIESEEEYIITESNLFKSENKNISEEEEKDFDLICRVFPSKL